MTLDQLASLLDEDQLDALDAVPTYEGTWQLDYGHQPNNHTAEFPTLEDAVTALQRLPHDTPAALYPPWPDLPMNFLAVDDDNQIVDSAVEDREPTLITFFDQLCGDVPNGPAILTFLRQLTF